MEDIQKYRALFFEETDEYLQSLNEHLLLLEKDTENMETIDEIFRSAHTLKGMAATMGYTTMTELTHHMENVLELFRSRTLSVTCDAVSVIFSCLDMLSEIVEDLRAENYPEYDITALLAELDGLTAFTPVEAAGIDSKETFAISFSDIGETDAGVIRAALDKGFHAFTIAVKVVDKCMLKGARAYLVVNRLEQQGEILQTCPGVEDLEEGKFDRVFRIIYLTNQERNDVLEAIENVAEIEEVLVQEITEESLPGAFSAAETVSGHEVIDFEKARKEVETRHSSK
ncbi:MAG TPA: Hpt domain-containing protein, partial [Clostridiaceae bacterium]|nr:Hpt domain-containing protein [Clostridiaceae bacterium]